MIGSYIGEYRVLDLVGVGGMGEVYRAVHTKIGRVVAIKVMTRAEHTATFNERFVNEARIQSTLSHPNIAALYDYTEINGSPSIIMEYVDGRLLCERIAERGTLDPADGLRLIRAVAEAVAYVHARGIVHRDIKSNNIKISSAGQAKLLDFGIARAATTPRLTDTGKTIGTIEYLAPEQLSGGLADARSDVWALGVLLYEMLTGATPFADENVGAMVKRIIRGAYTPASRLNPAVPHALEEIVARCLSRSPASRFASAGELADALARLDGGAAYLVREGKKKAAAIRARGAKRISPKWLAAPAALLLLAATGYFLLVAGGDEAGQTQTPHAASATPRPSGVGTVNTTIAVREGRAEVFVNGESKGTTPVTLENPEGAKIRLRLKQNGYDDYVDDDFHVEKLDSYPSINMNKSSPSINMNKK